MRLRVILDGFCKVFLVRTTKMMKKNFRFTGATNIQLHERLTSAP